MGFLGTTNYSRGKLAQRKMYWGGVSVTPGRIERFKSGVAFIGIPALLIVPVLKLPVVCPPFIHAEVVAVSTLVLFAVLEGWGVSKMLRCVSKRADLISICAFLLTLFGAATGIAALWLFQSAI
jgi:hypothetical protein